MMFLNILEIKDRIINKIDFLYQTGGSIILFIWSEQPVTMLWIV
jgi:hypothetical protein